MYRCAIVGVGGSRARGHAAAYQHISRGQLTVVSTRRQEKLDEFGEQFGVSPRYTDYREMFTREKPDLVHVNTPPNVRLEVLEAADEAGVRSVIVEKPIAMQGEDYEDLLAFSRDSSMKVAVNHQLHFHPRRMALQKLVAAGAIGDLRFVDGSSGNNPAYQGTHIIQGICAFNPGAAPTHVFAQASGANGLLEGSRSHYAPDELVAEIGFSNGVRAMLRCGPGAPRACDKENANMHKRVAAYGDMGHVEWTMWSWRTLLDGQSESGEHDYWAEDVLGQAAMTEAMFDWLEDDSAVHPLRLELALLEFNLLLGAYVSAIERRIVKLPCDPPDGLLERLRQTLAP